MCSRSSPVRCPTRSARSSRAGSPSAANATSRRAPRSVSRPPTIPEGVAWTRFHLAQDLVDAGLVTNMSAAFAGPLRLGPFGVPLPEAIRRDRCRAAGSPCGRTRHRKMRCAGRRTSVASACGVSSRLVPGSARRSARGSTGSRTRPGLGITGGSDWHARGGDLGVFSFPRREARPFLAALADRSPSAA